MPERRTDQVARSTFAPSFLHATAVIAAAVGLSLTVAACADSGGGEGRDTGAGSDTGLDVRQAPDSGADTSLGDTGQPQDTSEGSDTGTPQDTGSPGDTGAPQDTGVNQNSDTDEDGVLDVDDNCPEIVNPGQSDIDDDGRGDICDPDDDGDSVPDTADPEPTNPDWPGTVLPNTVYAHSADTLHRMDVETFQIERIGDFGWPSDASSTSMTDLAIDQYGVVYGISYNDVFRCHAETAECRRLAGLPGSFNGLTWLPAGTVEPDQEVLVGIAGVGDWYRLDVSGDTVSSTQIGSYGSGYTSSGDAFSTLGIGTFASVNGGGSDDVLIEVDPSTGTALSERATLSGYPSVFGLAGWTDSVFAFDSGGDVLRVDLQSGAITRVAETNVAWWGAAVRTVIPN